MLVNNTVPVMYPDNERFLPTPIMRKSEYSLWDILWLTCDIDEVQLLTAIKDAINVHIFHLRGSKIDNKQQSFQPIFCFIAYF